MLDESFVKADYNETVPRDNETLEHRIDKMQPYLKEMIERIERLERAMNRVMNNWKDVK